MGWYPAPAGAPREPGFYRVCIDAGNEDGGTFKAGGALVYAANQLAAQSMTEAAEWPRGLTITCHVRRFFVTEVNARNQALLETPETITQDVINRLSVGMQPERIEPRSSSESSVCLIQSLEGEHYLQAYMVWKSRLPAQIYVHVAHFNGKERTTAWVTNYGNIETAMAGTRERFDALIRILSDSATATAA